MDINYIKLRIASLEKRGTSPNIVRKLTRKLRQLEKNNETN